MNAPPSATRHTDQKRAHPPLDDGLDQGIPSFSSSTPPLNAGHKHHLLPSGKYPMKPTLTDSESIFKMPPPFLSNLDHDESDTGDHTSLSASKDDVLTTSSSPIPHPNVATVDVTASNVIRSPTVVEASFLGKHRDTDEFATPRPTKRPNRMAAENGIVDQQHPDPGDDPLLLLQDHTYPTLIYNSGRPSSVTTSDSRISPGPDRPLKHPDSSPSVHDGSIRVGVLELPIHAEEPASTAGRARINSGRKPTRRDLDERDQLIASILRNSTFGLPESTSENEDRWHGYSSEVPRRNPERPNPTPRFDPVTTGKSLSAQIVADGIIKPAEVQVLFRIFFEKLNPSLAILDPTTHTAAFVLSRSPFLFTTICAISSRYYRERPQLYPVAMRFAEQSASKTLVSGQKTVEVVQAYILMCAYPIPTHLREDDRTQIYLSLAIKMAVELHLHLPAAGTSTDGERERDHLNKERTWLICFNMIQSGSIQFGWPSMAGENGGMRDLRGWYKLSKHNTTMDIHLTAYTQIRSIVSRFLANIPPNHETTNNKLDFLTVTTNSDEELLALEHETRELFKRESNNTDSACKYRCDFFFFLVNHSRLILFSFGYQQALIHGLKHGKTFSNQCYEAASKVLRIVIQDLAPSGWLMYSLDEHFVFISFAAAFLLRMLQSPFVSALNPTQSSTIIPLVTDLARVLESNKVVIDDQHSPRLYSRFLSGLIAKQVWTDNFLLPGFNASFSESAGGPTVDVRQWYIMNRGAVFPGVATDRDMTLVIDASQELHGANQKPNIALRPESSQSASGLHLQLMSDLSYDTGSAESRWSPQTTRFMSGEQIAIKTLRFNVNCGTDDRKSLKHAARELYAWSKCRHRNVQHLLGLVEFRDRIGMVSTWEDNGSLSEYLQRWPEANRVWLIHEYLDKLRGILALGGKPFYLVKYISTVTE
ncbi:hypothetical protein FRC09_015285 [Ceratobasidium sp. 395]|nr:hypothetical protein FRC09_015285 [Ceratobasidium sp. 395]